MLVSFPESGNDTSVKSNHFYDNHDCLNSCMLVDLLFVWSIRVQTDKIILFSPGPFPSFSPS